MDELGNIHSAPNSFLDLLSRMLTDWLGILLVTVPLALLVIIFFILKHYSNNEKALKIYFWCSLIFYIVYFLLITQLFTAV